MNEQITFDEILETSNTRTQCKRVKAYIEQHGEISQRDAYKMGIYRLSGRIYDLKEQGERIVTEMRTVENADGSKARVAFYKFAEVGA